MRRWLDSNWYLHLWRRLTRHVSVFVLLPALAVLATGGFAAAYAFRDNNPQATKVVRLQAVKSKVRVNGRERVVTRYVTLATTDYARPSTVFQTRLVTEPVVKTVRAAPVVRRQLVYVTGKGSTVTRQQTRVATETSFQTVTQPTTVVDSQTVTRRVTVTAPVLTVTVTGAVITVTLPQKTVTRTTTVTVKSPPPPPPGTTTQP
jgi:hypothetical protein